MNRVMNSVKRPKGCNRCVQTFLLFIALFALQTTGLRVDTVSKEGEKVTESVFAKKGQTFSSLRASMSPDSPLRFSAFCVSTISSLDLPFWSMDKEADDDEYVNSYFLGNDSALTASFIFVANGGSVFGISVCGGTTFEQLRERLGIYMDNRDFNFVMDEQDESCLLTKYVIPLRLSTLRAGQNILSLFSGEGVAETIRKHTINIAPGTPSTNLQQKKKAERHNQNVLNIAVTLPDESIVIVNQVSVGETSVSEFREKIGQKLTEKQRTQQYSERVALCDPTSNKEMDENELLSKYLAKHKEHVALELAFTLVVDWQSGSETPLIVTVCPNSTYKQIISRALPSMSTVKSVQSYAIEGGKSIGGKINSKYVSRYRTSAGDEPLHLRHRDSILVHIQDAEKKRHLMVRSSGKYLMSSVREQMEKLLGTEVAWSLALCTRRSENRLSQEISPNKSLSNYRMDEEGVEFEATLVRAKCTFEDKALTKDLSMTVCDSTTTAELKSRLCKALSIPDNTLLTFLDSRRGKAILDKDLDLSEYRFHPAVQPTRSLNVWIGKYPFWLKDRTLLEDGHSSHFNVVVTLPDESVLILENVAGDTNISGLRELIGQRLPQASKDSRVHHKMALCAPLNGVPMEPAMRVDDYLGYGDNILQIGWINVKDWPSGSDEVHELTVCGGDTYLSLFTRALPSFPSYKDSKRMELMDGGRIDSLVNKVYLEQESGVKTGKLLQVKLRDQVVLDVQGSDGKSIAVGVKRDGKVSDIRSALVEKLGASKGWGVGLCKKPGLVNRFLGGPLELDPSSPLSAVSLNKDGTKLKAHRSLTCIIRMNGTVSRIPVTLCSDSLEELKERMRLAVGAKSDDLVMIAEEERDKASIWRKYIPAFAKDTSLVHMDIVCKAPGSQAKLIMEDASKETAGDNRPSVVTEDGDADKPSKGDSAPAAANVTKAQDGDRKRKRQIKILLVSVGVVVLLICGYIMLSENAEASVDVVLSPPLYTESADSVVVEEELQK